MVTHEHSTESCKILAESGSELEKCRMNMFPHVHPTYGCPRAQHCVLSKLNRERIGAREVDNLGCPTVISEFHITKTLRN
jgi:hypothetical protein